MHRRTPLRMGPLRFRDPVLLCGVLYGLLLFDASGFLRTGLLAAFLHEWGHILVYCAQQRRFPGHRGDVDRLLYAAGQCGTCPQSSGSGWRRPVRR